MNNSLSDANYPQLLKCNNDEHLSIGLSKKHCISRQHSANQYFINIMLMEYWFPPFLLRLVLVYEFWEADSKYKVLESVQDRYEPLFLCADGMQKPEFTWSK